MSDAVNEGAEQTDLDSSQESEVESTNDEPETEDLSSSEDVNAQSEGEGEELGEQAMKEVKSERAKNRVQELANQNRSLKQEIEALRQQQLQASYQQQPQTQDEYIQAEMARQRMELQQTKEEIAWAEAVRQNPQLDRGNPDYSPEFENLVYANYIVRMQKGEMISPAEVAKETSNYLNKVASRASSKSDVIREVKKSVAPLGGQRKPSGEEYSKYQAAKGKFMQSGSIDDLASLFSE